LPCHERIRYVLREISARVAGNELILHFGPRVRALCHRTCSSAEVH
jgi:hypothetical protein